MHSEEPLSEPLLMRAMHRRIEMLRQVVAEVVWKTKPLVVPRGKRMLVEQEEGQFRRVLRVEKAQTELDQRLAEGSQRLMRGMKLPQAGFG